jgi:hypothetical protein
MIVSAMRGLYDPKLEWNREITPRLLIEVRCVFLLKGENNDCQ